jgi:GTP-binding protein HflX
VVELVIPYERGDVLAELHREGEIVSESHGDDGVRVRARLDPAARGRLAEFAASNS